MNAEGADGSFSAISTEQPQRMVGGEPLRLSEVGLQCAC